MTKDSSMLNALWCPQLQYAYVYMEQFYRPTKKLMALDQHFDTIWVSNSYSIVLYHKNSSLCLYWHKACSFEIWIWGCWKNSVKISTIWTPMYHLSVYKCKSARSGQSVQVWEKQLTFLYQQICSGLNDQ